MQRLGLMRIMKRQRMKYEEFESIYPVTIYQQNNTMDLQFVSFSVVS